jgi:hypothetical protein
MLGKMKVLVIIMLLNLSTILILDNQDSFVEASINNKKIDGTYIYNITKELSWIVNKTEPHFGIQKGRAFGTPGEHDAAGYLMKEIRDNLSLYDPTEFPNLPYWENISEKPNDKIDDKLEIKARGIKINGTDSVKDCFISPRWEDMFIRYNPNVMTNNYSYNNLKVYREGNKEPDWWTNVVNQTLVNDALNNESITNLSTFLKLL